MNDNSPAQHIGRLAFVVFSVSAAAAAVALVVEWPARWLGVAFVEAPVEEESERRRSCCCRGKVDSLQLNPA